MRFIRSTQAERRTPTPFEVFLRTGRRNVEVKFNPWHDPDDGRFTFAGQGVYYGRGGAADVAGPSNNARQQRPKADRVRSVGTDAQGAAARTDPKHPRNYALHVVRAGESLLTIAARRRGVTPADLAWLNDLAVDRPLKVGQQIKLPHQSFLDAGRDAKNRFLALSLYMDTHGGKLPPNPAKPPSIAEQVSALQRTETKNGYHYNIDAIERTQLVFGELSRERREPRSKTSQTRAGGADRLPGDHGGHYIARRFNGPRDPFNHFAQDAGFNQGSYKKMENQWAAELDAGRRVSVIIKPRYEGLSQRPYQIQVEWRVGASVNKRKFKNSPKGN